RSKGPVRCSWARPHGPAPLAPRVLLAIVWTDPDDVSSVTICRGGERCPRVRLSVMPRLRKSRRYQVRLRSDARSLGTRADRYVQSARLCPNIEPPPR